MKDHFKTFLCILGSFFIVYIFLCGIYGMICPPEDMSVEQFMEHHSVEEIAEFFDEQGDLAYVASVFNEELDKDYYFISAEEAARMVDYAYAHGYYAGATNEYNLEDAVRNQDIDEIYDYTSGTVWPDDFLH